MKKDLTPIVEAIVHFHRGENREDNDFIFPYSVHPIECMRLGWRWGIRDYDTLAALGGHDLKENTKITQAELDAVFTPRSQLIIDELTYKPELGTKAEYMAGWASKSIESVVAKMCDRFINVSDFMITKPDYASKYCRKASALFQVVRDRQPEIFTKFGYPMWNNMYDAFYRIDVDLLPNEGD